MTTTLSVMMRWFETETENYSFICECGKLVELPRVKNKRKKCDECLYESSLQRANNYHYNNDINENTKTVGDPSLDLVLAVIRQAKIDRNRGWNPNDKEELNLKDCDPVEFLENGARLWLECAGISVDYDTERNLKKLIDKRNNRSRG